MKAGMLNILSTLLLLLSVQIMATQLTDGGRTHLASKLSKSLLCVGDPDNSAVGEPENDAMLKNAGAVITMSEDPYYNQFRYSFSQPLDVDGLHLYAIQQFVGEGGVIFMAEVEGDPKFFAKQIDALSAKKDETYLGVQNVSFYKNIGNKIMSLAEPNYKRVIIGQNQIQKIQGRFFYGCVQPMDL
jgi:hypothetical protein